MTVKAIAPRVHSGPDTGDREKCCPNWVMPFLQSNYATSALSLLVPDMVFHSRGACAPEFCQSHGHEKPFARKATRVPSGAPGGARVVGHATRTDVATRPRFGRGARHRRSACANRLLRARCASRRSTTVLRRGCRPPPPESRLSLLPTGITGWRP